MSETGRTMLFLGGPMDGELRAVAEPYRPVTVAILIRSMCSWADTDMSPSQPACKTAFYEPTRLVCFGSDLLVMVFENLPTEQLEHRMLQHLLSDNAKACVV